MKKPWLAQISAGVMLTIATAVLLAACFKGWHTHAKVPPMDRKDLERLRRDSDAKCKDWMYPFE